MLKCNSKLAGVAGSLFFVFLWASAFVPSKLGVQGSSPLWFLSVRFLAAGIIAFAMARVLGARMPANRREWAALVLLGACNNALYLGCTYEALRHLSPGLAAIIASLNPIVLALAAAWLLAEALTPQKIAGMLLGFGGVVFIVAFRGGNASAAPADVLFAFAGVLASAAGTVVFKRWCSDFDLRTVTAIQLLAAGVMTLPLALAFEGTPRATMSIPFVTSFLYVTLVMSVGAALLWFWLLARGEASRVSAYYFLTPVFGLGFAAALLHESVSIRDAGGLVAVALGIILVQRS